MTQSYHKPDLPEKAQTVLIGEKYKGCFEKAARRLGFSIQYVPNNPDVDMRLSGHVDLSLLDLGGMRIAAAPYLKKSAWIQKLQEQGVRVLFPEIRQGRSFPNDVQLNVCVIGSRFLYAENRSSADIVNILSSEGLKGMRVKQAYTRCSCCVITENAVITSDHGIARGVGAAGLDVLEVAPGFIELEGFSYGFIGGASFKISESTIAFTGHLDAHPDRMRILQFIQAHGVKAVFLTDRPIFDIGGGILITEKGTQS